jgi:hypothetical protein
MDIIMVQVSLVNCRIMFLKNAPVDKTRAVLEIGGYGHHNHCCHSSKPKLLIPSLYTKDIVTCTLWLASEATREVA